MTNLKDVLLKAQDFLYNTKVHGNKIKLFTDFQDIYYNDRE